MRYLKFTYVDAVTGVPVTQGPARNGPVPPDVAGLEFGFALESEYPTLIPVLYGTCPEESVIDLPGVLAELSGAEFQAALGAEMVARRERLTQQIADRRWRAEVAGIVWHGHGIATDRESQQKMSDERSAVKGGLRTDGKGWKCLDLVTGAVVFRPTSNAEILDLTAAAYRHVSDCFDREGQLLAAMADGTFTPEMLDEGWPNEPVPESA